MNDAQKFAGAGAVAGALWKISDGVMEMMMRRSATGSEKMRCCEDGLIDDIGRLRSFKIQCRMSDVRC